MFSPSPPKSRWWFQIFLFSPPSREMIQFDEHIFQMGWNHQLPTTCRNYSPIFKLKKTLGYFSIARWTTRSLRCTGRPDLSAISLGRFESLGSRGRGESLKVWPMVPWTHQVWDPQKWLPCWDGTTSSSWRIWWMYVLLRLAVRWRKNKIYQRSERWQKSGSAKLNDGNICCTPGKLI